MIYYISHMGYNPSGKNIYIARDLVPFLEKYIFQWRSKWTAV